MTKVLFVVCVFLLLLASAATAGGDSHELYPTEPEHSLADSGLTYVSSALWAPVWDFVVHGNYMYCGYSAGIKVVDVSNPSAPTEVSRVLTSGSVRAIAIKGDRLYAGYATSGVEVFSIVEPALPVSMGFYPCERDYMDALFVVKDTAFMGFSGGIQIVDMSNPAVSIHLSTLSFDAHSSGFWPHGMAIVDSIVHVCAGRHFVFDISDILNPVRVPEMEIDTLDLTYNYLAFDLILADTLMYLASQSSSFPSLESTLAIYSLAAQAPQKLGEYEFWGNIHEIALHGDRVWAGTEYSGPVAFDVSDPTAPMPVSCVYPPLGYAEDCQLAGNLLFVSSEALWWHDGGFWPNSMCDAPPSESCALDTSLHQIGDMLILDVSLPYCPKVVGSWQGSKSTTVVSARNNLLLAGSALGGVTVLMEDGPDGLCTLARVSDSMRVDVVEISNNVGIASTWLGQMVIDLSVPSAPQLLSYTNALGGALDIAVQWPYAYGANFPNWFHIADISDPANPVRVGSWPVPGSSLGIEVAGSYAYLTDNVGLRVLDVSNPQDPTLVNTCLDSNLAGFTKRVRLASDSLLVISSNASAVLLDISDPINPVRLSRHVSPGVIYDMDAKGDLLALCGIDMGALVVDISDPTSPVSIHDSRTGSRSRCEWT